MRSPLLLLAKNILSFRTMLAVNLPDFLWSTSGSTLWTFLSVICLTDSSVLLDCNLQDEPPATLVSFTKESSQTRHEGEVRGQPGLQVQSTTAKTKQSNPLSKQQANKTVPWIKNKHIRILFQTYFTLFYECLWTVCVCTMCELSALVGQRKEASTGSHRTGAPGSYEMTRRCWELNPAPMRTFLIF